MTKLLNTLALSTLFLLAGCAHNIQINPPLDGLRSTQASASELSVGYYISSEDKSAQVTTAGGGGDKIAYYPYKDTEAALNTILSNLYRNVYSVPALTDKDFVTAKKINYVFKPKLTTTSSSNSAFTWPPTDFSLTITCTAVDPDGKEVWHEQVTGTGHAEFSEFKSDFPLAARRATEDAFKKLQEKISSAPVLKK